MSPSKRSQGPSDWRCPSLVLSRPEIVEHFLFLKPLSSGQSMVWCPWFCARRLVSKSFRYTETQATVLTQCERDIIILTCTPTQLITRYLAVPVAQWWCISALLVGYTLLFDRHLSSLFGQCLDFNFLSAILCSLSKLHSHPSVKHKSMTGCLSSYVHSASYTVILLWNTNPWQDVSQPPLCNFLWVLLSRFTST